MSTEQGIVIADKLNVRSRPELNASILCQLIKGTPVKIIRPTGDWLELNLSTLEGYVNRAFVRLNLASPERQDEITYGVIDAEALNIRTGPGYEHATVAVINRGTLVEILNEQSGWIQVKTKQIRGFVMKNLIVEIIGGTPVAGELYSAAVNEKLVNLRSGPGETYPILGILSKDTTVNVYHLSDGWAEIETIMYQGYIRKEFVKKSAAEGQSTTHSDAITTATVISDGLLLRTGPAENSPSLAMLNSGTPIKVLDMAATWLLVRVLLSSGYVASKFIRSLSPETPVQSPVTGDALQPPPNQIIPIQNNFSVEQKTMANTWNQYGGLIKKICQQYSLDHVVALAVLSVESGGKGFAPDGRMIIRFENHYFYNYWGATNQSLYQRHFRFDANSTWQKHEFRPSTSAPWQPVHTGQQSDEWQVFQFASQLNRPAAMMSISMGSPQIMGANFSILRYASAEDMYYAFQSDIRNQLGGLFRYIEGRNLFPSLRSENFVAFAQVYNGPANASAYGNKIKKHVNEFRLISDFTFF